MGGFYTQNALLTNTPSKFDSTSGMKVLFRHTFIYCLFLNLVFCWVH